MKGRRPSVLVVGGGFGGLHVARGLAQTDADVVVIDRQNHHLFQPLLYQVASAVLSPADIAQPIRGILRDQGNAQVALGEVEHIDLENRTVSVSGTATPYDYLVLAAGATHSYFGNDDWATHAPGLKTVDDALEIRRRVLTAFELAENEGDEAARRARLTFVVVGGGPTGVELAGALKEIAAESIPRDFRRIDTTTTRVVLVEGRDRLLPAMSPAAGEQARRDLEQMGVEVRLNSLVTRIYRNEVEIGDERLRAANTFWAAGVTASPLAKTLGAPLDEAGRVRVRPDCTIPSHPEVFVIGDMATLDDPNTGRPVPGVAQAAMQMGDFVASVIDGEVSGRSVGKYRPVFHYRDKGNMATIGRARAVADIGRRTFTGHVAWLMWSLVHVLFLIGFRNKLFVMLSWIWSYLVGTKGARLITGSPDLGLERPEYLFKETLTDGINEERSTDNRVRQAAPNETPVTLSR